MNKFGQDQVAKRVNSTLLFLSQTWGIDPG